MLQYNNMNTVDDISKMITPYLKQYPISYAGLFGSYARDDFREDSDVDVLIRYSRPFNLFDMGKLLNSLESVTGKKFDLVPENTVHPLMMKYIKKTLVKII